MPGSEEDLAHPEECFPFVEARCALEFEGTARRIVTTYKDNDELRLDAVMAALLCAAMRGRRVDRDGELAHLVATGVLPRQAADLTAWADALVCVPASPEAKLRRGFDHMMRIGLICSAWTGLRLMDLLSSRKGVSDQRRLGRAERIENRTASFAFTTPHDGRVPRKVVLLDDVFTTGATLSTATRALLDGGVGEVAVVSFARVW